MIDIGAKRDALRVKLIGKFLDSTRQHPWRDTLAGYLAEYGERSVYNLCICSPRNAHKSLPGFYQEVLEAWGKILPHLKPDCSRKEHVMQLPFLSNPCLAYQGRCLVSSHLAAAGLTRLGQVMNAKGHFDLEKVLSTLTRMNVKYRKTQIISIGERIEQSLSPEWRDLLRKGGCKGQGNALNFLLCLGDKTTPISAVKTKDWYQLFTSKIAQRPASEKTWQTIFPSHTVSTIWENIDIPLMNPSVFHSDFKIRHRRIFTGVVLH